MVMVNNFKDVFDLLHPRLLKAIRLRGYQKPTPIQEKAIPVILRGVDTLIIGPTGSGKTEAALFPLASKILSSYSNSNSIKLLYITPLRSLNRDIFARIVGVLEDAGLHVMVRHGDSSRSEKLEFLRKPPDIAIMTPETFYFMLSVDKFIESIKDLKAVVIDEFHELVDDERGVELLLALERLEKMHLHRRVQRVALSATLSNPRLAAQILAPDRHVEIVEADVRKRYAIRVVVGVEDEEARQVAEKLGIPVDLAARLVAIKRIVSKLDGGILLFTNTRDTAELLGALLSKVLGEDKVAVHHGSLSKSERVSVEQRFREGKLKLVVATASLELGIDIGHVKLVIQYMSPRQAVKLLQRIGRAGHKFHEVSYGIVLASKNLFDILESAVLARRAMDCNLEPMVLPDSPYDALLHQLVGSVIEFKEIKPLEFYSLATILPYYYDFDYEKFKQVLEFADSTKILRVNESMVREGRRAKRYYFSTTMIADVEQYDVIDLERRTKIGVLDEEFVASLEEGSFFVLGGRVWEFVGVEKDKVYVRQARQNVLILPAWEGELIPVEFKTARELGSILRRYERVGARVLERYPLSIEAREYVLKVLKEQSKVSRIPTDKRIVVEIVPSHRLVFIYAFWGSRCVRAFELFLNGLIRSLVGYSPASSSSPYGVVLQFASSPSRELIESVFKTIKVLKESEIENIVVEALKRHKVFEWYTLRVAKKMGIEIPKDASKSLVRRLGETIVGEEALKELNQRKVDVKCLIDRVKDIKEGKLEISIVVLKEISPFAKELLQLANMVVAGYREKGIPSTLLKEIYARRFSDKRIEFVCLMCGHRWSITFSMLDDKPSCPRCSSRFIAPLIGVDIDANTLVESIRSRRRSPELKKLLAMGNLVLTYGKKAVEALLVPGVGPTIAQRVLAKLALGEEAFYKALAECEKRFVQTRKYWRK
ncbi:MAG TPA: DEAD/DEAH box helicase [Pyrodictium sp.]|nr:DEAD/DEAH box helicase [Pyrodictium sp.]